MPRSLVGILAFLSTLASAGCDRKPTTMEEYYTREVTLPGGRKIRAEVMTHPTDMMRGMMFRDSLAPDRGMLFIHAEPGNYSYWMHQVKIPLDIIWLDSSQAVVEIQANTPPCHSGAKDCPQYGGRERSQYVLELGGGMAAKYGLRVGDRVVF